MVNGRNGGICCIGIALALLLTVGCGGGGDSKSVSATTIAGSVTAGTIDGASLTVLDKSGAVVAGPVGVSDGMFSVDVPDEALAGDLIFESVGGSYTDEATGTPGVPAGTFSAYVTAGSLSAGSVVHIGAGSTSIREAVRNGMEYSAAEAAFANAFGETVDIFTAIADPSSPAADATVDELRAGLRNAAFSQLTLDLGLLPGEQSALLAALGSDLADGDLDGQSSAGPVSVGVTSLPDDIRNLYERAVINFHDGPNDGTGLKNDQIGSFSFAKTAYAGDYRIEYSSYTDSMDMMGKADMTVGMDGPTEGRSVFSLSVADASGTPVAGLNLSVVPWMFMDAHTHTTPVDAVVDNGDGTYTCTVYYLMASSMANGMMMGYWELRVGIGDDTAYFYPTVAMAMGDTKKVTLKDADDKIAGMMGDPPTVRNYYIFNEGLTGSTGSHTLKLFIATRQSMTNHPAVFVGAEFADENGAAWTVDTMTVEVSTNGGLTWLPLSDEGAGHWSVSGLTDLTSGDDALFEVRMSINGAAKTTDGMDSGGNAVFNITVP